MRRGHRRILENPNRILNIPKEPGSRLYPILPDMNVLPYTTKGSIPLLSIDVVVSFMDPASTAWL